MSHAPSAASSRAPAAPPHSNRLEEILAVYAPSAPKIAAWLEENLPQGFTVISLPPAHQARLRTSNALERINQEIKRRTRVARVFPTNPSFSA